MNRLIISDIQTGAHVHFIGIGGAHMRGHAEQMHNSGYIVSGSDHKASAATEQLAAMGIRVAIGHARENLAAGTALVIYTAAVPPDNAELAAAREQNIPLMERAEFLGQLMKNYKHPVCVAGTHGKTTATSMTAEIFLAADADPTIAIGGILPSIGSGLRDGGRDAFIVESCEYCDTFLRFFPYIGVILNVDFDHADYFADLAHIYQSFRRFAERIPAEGALVINGTIERLAELTSALPCRVVTVDAPAANWFATDIVYDANGCASFTAQHNGMTLGTVRLSVPGRHNVSNALAAMAAASLLGIAFDAMTAGLARFGGAKRRYDRKGVTAAGVTIIDDFAHHPTEIRTTLAAAKSADFGRVVCIFQPHTRSRTQELFNEFSACFDDADEVVLLDIYEPAGREEHSYSIHSRDLAQSLAARGVRVFYADSFGVAAAWVQKNCLHNDVCITMGAGNVSELGAILLS